MKNIRFYSECVLGVLRCTWKFFSHVTTKETTYRRQVSDPTKNHSTGTDQLLDFPLKLNARRESHNFAF